jgi:hypothetical protein
MDGLKTAEVLMKMQTDEEIYTSHVRRAGDTTIKSWIV